MVSLLSIGIQKYEYSNLEEIHCATLDSLKVYDAIKSILGDDFSEHQSVCLNNITSISFKSIISSYKYMFSKDSASDYLILYFSGHAGTYENSFSLCFSDFKENFEHFDSSGYIAFEEIIKLLGKIACEKIVILDCCFSGSGLSMANTSVLDHRISIISSNNENGLAHFDEKGSLFTKCLCDSLYEIKTENIDFTLNELQNRMNAKHSTSCLNMGAGITGNVLLKERANLEIVFYDFEKRFYDRISKSDRFFREASWYSLSGLPFDITKKVYYEVFLCLNPFSRYPLEASWLVRRAIGSSISAIENKQYRLLIVKKLISSTYWQEQCIGIIGARYDFENDENLVNYVEQKIKQKWISKVDAVWLANLYIAESHRYNYLIFLNSSLSKTVWGIQEIYKSAARNNISIDTFHKSLNRLIHNSSCSYQKKAILSWQNTIIKPETEKPVLYEIIARQEYRGRLPKNSPAKFILSTLYGNWRESKSLNLKQYFESQNDEVIKRELSEAASFKEVEFRMAIFHYLVGDSVYVKRYFDYLKWGLSDLHPWVRRTAIQAFKAGSIEQEKTNYSILNYFENNPIEQIGEIDLLLEYVEKDLPSDSNILRFVKSCNRFSDGDYRSIAFSIYNYFVD